jgi:hypothetical protein
MTRLAEQIKVSEVIKWGVNEKGVGNFVIATKETGVEREDVDELLRQYGKGQGSDIKAEHTMFAAAITEPILQAVPYKRWTDKFLMKVNYGLMEDNRIPREYYVSTAWQNGPDAEALFVRPGFGFTRPNFVDFQTGIEMPWSVMEYSGWNILGRMMERATEELARKIDLLVQAALDAAVDGQPGQGSVVAGGLMTKAAIDAVVKAGNALGFPVRTALVNSGTQTDMSAWSGGPFYNAALPPTTVQQILQTLYLGEYGGISFFNSPFVPTNFVYFTGPPNATGYEQTRGSGKTASDVDIRKRIDIHAVWSAPISISVENALNVRRLKIAA